MKILLTGATGYIGRRLLPKLVEHGHQVICCVRDRKRFNANKDIRSSIEVVEVDFLDNDSLQRIPKNIDGAYYLMHSMSTTDDYEDLETQCATNFRKTISQTRATHVVYLSGIINEEALSRHLASRAAVEKELSIGTYHLTTLRAGIIIGSGSASFEIIRDLVEKLPVMVAPKWLHTRCQPIGISDVISFLHKSLWHEAVYDQSFDIGGPDILSYKEMLLGYAKIRGLKRSIITVPIMTPKLSSYWLYFVTSTSYKLASSLVSSMKVEVICRNRDINKILHVEPSDYHSALRKTLYQIKGNQILSSWKDSWVSGQMNPKIGNSLEVPTFGCFKDCRSKVMRNREESLLRLWKIGGDTGWYFANWLWRFRGLIDKAFGGVGLRRGRTHPHNLQNGDAIDFWRVLYVNKEEGRLLLFAEMKLPGEAWLEFRIRDTSLEQTATFRPKGLLGRLYWYAVLPFHGLIFEGMLRKLAE